MMEQQGDRCKRMFASTVGELPEEWKKRLSARLEHQVELYSRLLELARRKRSILTTAPAVDEEKAKALESIVQEETAIIARLEVLDQDNGSALECPEIWNSREIVSSVPGDREVFERLSRVVQELKRLNRENGEILKCFQRYVDFAVDLLKKKAWSGMYREAEPMKGTVEKVASRRSRISRQA